jgi:dipeptidase E
MRRGNALMKYLLTSGGIRNDSIKQALVNLIGKPIAESHALFIPTATYAHPMAGSKAVYRSITGSDSMAALGWKTVGVLELTTLPSLSHDRWVPWVEAADVLLVDGGDAIFLRHWMKESGLVHMLPTLDAVWVGVSAGSMVMAPRIGREFVTWPEPRGEDAALGIVGFAIFPHLEYPGWSSNTMASAEKWFANLDCPAYAIDDDTAISVVDGNVQLISEGLWRAFER